MVGGNGESRRGRGEGQQHKQKNESFFPTNQWQWWVIFLNSTKTSFVEHLLKYSTKSTDLGVYSTFFRSRSAVELLELDMFLARETWSGVCFSDLELPEVVPNTP
jgi:hypothetical protein